MKRKTTLTLDEHTEKLVTAYIHCLPTCGTSQKSACNCDIEHRQKEFRTKLRQYRIAKRTPPVFCVSCKKDVSIEYWVLPWEATAWAARCEACYWRELRALRKSCSV